MTKRAPLFISIWLGVVTFTVFWPVVECDFVNYDDGLYVTQNPQVRRGLTWDGAIWALQTTHASNWHPVVWLSHMLDCSLFGLFSGGHHLTSLLLHVLNTILLFLLLKRMTGAIWRSTLVAALFGLHPLHVESVAWVAERKDVLSTLFWLLTIWAYTYYVERPIARRYGLVLLLFALGLMTKPMLVTLPLVLLLLDYWPLGRLGAKSGQTGERQELATKSQKTFLELVQEKWPFFALSAVSCALTIWAQRNGGAIKSLEAVPLAARFANGTTAYGAYLWKMIWPLDLAVLYPIPTEVPLKGTICSGLILAVISFVAVRLRRRHPAMIIGWLWFLGTLVPVIGFVQVGAQAMADRYTYLPLIGIFILIAWGLGDLKPGSPRTGVFKLAVCGATLAICAFLTSHQLQYWQDGATLFEHTTRVTKGNYIAHNNLGNALSAQGRDGQAIAEFSEALRIHPDYTQAHFNLATELANQGQTTQALAHLSQVLRLNPQAAEAHNNFGVMLAQRGEFQSALNHFAAAVAFKPAYLNAHLNLAGAYAQMGRFKEAVATSHQALQVASDTGQKELISQIQDRLQFYLKEKPYHEITNRP